MGLLFETADKENFKEWLMEALTENGLVITKKEVAVNGLVFEKEQAELLKQKHLSAYQVCKAKLLPGHPTLDTVKNMIIDGRIAKGEYFTGKKNELRLMVFAIKRLRGE